MTTVTEAAKRLIGGDEGNARIDAGDLMRASISLVAVAHDAALDAEIVERQAADVAGRALRALGAFLGGRDHDAVGFRREIGEPATVGCCLCKPHRPLRRQSGHIPALATLPVDAQREHGLGQRQAVHDDLLAQQRPKAYADVESRCREERLAFHSGRRRQRHVVETQAERREEGEGCFAGYA